MMLRYILATGMLASSIVAPLTAHAYVSPEDVLDDGNYSTRFYDPPPSRRSIEETQRLQQERSAARRQAELDALNPPEPEPEEEELHGAAPDEDTTPTMEELLDALRDLQNDNADGGLTSEEQRLIERIRAQQSQSVLSGDETLHSGAPLSETGPAAVLTVLAIAGAVGETWRRVKKSEK